MEEAMELLQSVLTGEIGGSTLLVEPADAGATPWATKSVAHFMDSRAFPFRGLYTAPLVVENKKVGRLVACFGSFGAPEKTLSQLTAHIAQQLGDVLVRTRRTPFHHVIPLSVSQAGQFPHSLAERAGQ
jgi:hypothetical protein